MTHSVIIAFAQPKVSFTFCFVLPVHSHIKNKYYVPHQFLSLTVLEAELLDIADPA